MGCPSVTFSFRTRALLGFLPKSIELTPNQFILHLGFGTNLPWFRVPSIFSSLVRSRATVLLGHASNALYEPISRTVARPVNLAQASQSRPRLMGGVDQRHGFDICVHEDFISGRVNSLESLGETFGVALQWSRRNSMAPVSGCPWWCPICITSSGVSSSGVSRDIHHKCKHPLNPTKLYLTRFVAWLCCMWLFFLAMIIDSVDGSRWAKFSWSTREW
ncbi:hypothetical protein DEO72_LG5g1267 [Vigna unguiculata]|uniref:Uncharacterized protein n=1 Tax=Vigna unguiculata TaxID=3917 RepID=A0A4D6LWZ6_VIGUN|nr:hypothetical protein DEO72_LG5g1267 [Vigna unguiculata]